MGQLERPVAGLDSVMSGDDPIFAMDLNAIDIGS